MHQTSHPYVLQQLMESRESELARAAARHSFERPRMPARRRHLWVIPAREPRVRTILNETVQLPGA